MGIRRKYALAFAITIALFFLPSEPRVAELMTRLWCFSIAVYWILLTALAIALGFSVLEGGEE